MLYDAESFVPSIKVDWPVVAAMVAWAALIGYVAWSAL